MKLNRILCAVLSVITMARNDTRSQWIVSGSVTILDTTVSGVIVTSTGSLTARRVTVTGDVTIQSGGTVTHSAGMAGGLQLVIGDSLRVNAGGLIHANARGNTNSLSNNWGGSYGGIGAKGPSISSAYGVVEEARLLGSGGYLTRGGGAVYIRATVVELQGEIQSNGEPGISSSCALSNNSPGGGSGGSIQIEAGKITGSGFLRANGGSATCNIFSNQGGGGGGGRIVLRYDSTG